MTWKITPIELAGAATGLFEITPPRFTDHRGFLSEAYNADELARHGIDIPFIQDNHSHSLTKGTVRGLHFQAPPFAQAKLVRVVRGTILDIALDIRVGSPSFGRHVAVEVSAEKGNQMLVPAGFAHGFCTLTPETDVIYKLSAPHSKEHERGVLWTDPDLGIDWPVTPESAVVSEKDRTNPLLKELPPYFRWA